MSVSPKPTPLNSKPPTLMRSLGQFFGHIVQGATAEPGSGAATPPLASPLPAPQLRLPAPQSVVIDHRVEEHTRQVPGGGGVVRVRRTIIDEVEMDPPASPAAMPSAPAPTPAPAQGNRTIAPSL